MVPTQQRRIILGMLLSAMCLGALLFVSGLSSTLQLGNANIRGFLLIPSLPTPLYVTMALVVLLAVGLALLASFVENRRRPVRPQKKRAPEPVKSFWQSMVGTLAWVALLLIGVVWLMRHGAHLIQLFERIGQEIKAMPGMLTEGTRSLMRQVDSSVAGVALFVTVLVVYGGLALVALWVLCAGRGLPRSERNNPHTRQVRRAVAAGLRELRQHADPRLAIIACYARLEHLLKDYGVPMYPHLTPQEYMGTVLQGLDLPLEAFAGLVELFERARYSLHPLNDAARKTAAAHLETLKTHLELETTLATRI